ncbi:acyl-CoA dehydrogenase family protein [Aneurinibacillus sp. BA2021]|nr:acyl-CoA dehydrogenase family protein [Aneurinibacillus sp. BA2021]
MNVFRKDPNLLFVLKQYLDAELYAWAEQALDEFGEICGTDIDRRAVHTDREGQPRLIRYDRMGHEVSEVWVNEGYRQTVADTYNRGIVGYIHKEIPELGRRGGYMYSFAQGYLLSQVEPGFYCPVTLTMAAAYLLEQYADENVKQRFLPHVLSTGEVPLFEGATFLTERQGGSDVGANEVRAERAGDVYKLYGEKYFASNAGMCGVAMVLARMDGAQPGTKGLSLFAVPWRKDDGAVNGLYIRRLKDKLGVRAVPSGEVVFEGAEAYLVGDAAKGFYYMMEALNLSRVCNAVASIGIMQRAFLEAKSYAYQRSAFGKRLADFPMVRETLANMAAKQEVETSAVFSILPLFERVMLARETVTEDEVAMNRLLIALLKMETAEQAIHFAHEAIELHGGNGYIEDFVTPRLLRDAQVLTVWEGTANILGLEVLRLLRKYNVHQTFIAYVRRELHALPDELAVQRETVEQAVQRLERMLVALTAMSEDAQTYHCKKVARRMNRIYESVIALKDAVIGGERKQILADLYLRSTWGDADVDIEMLPVAHFDLIMNEKSRVTAQ